MKHSIFAVAMLTSSISLLAQAEALAPIGETCTIYAATIPQGTQIGDWITTQNPSSAQFALKIKQWEMYVPYTYTEDGYYENANPNRVYVDVHVEAPSGYSSKRIVWYTWAHNEGLPERTIVHRHNKSLLAKMSKAKGKDRYERLKKRLRPDLNVILPSRNLEGRAIETLGSCKQYL